MLARLIAVVGIFVGLTEAPATAANTMNMNDTYLCTVLRAPGEREKRTIDTIIVPWVLGYLGRTSFTLGDMQTAKDELNAFCRGHNVGSIVDAADSMRRAK